MAFKIKDSLRVGTVDVVNTSGTVISTVDNTGSITTRAAATQDAVKLLGRAGGTSSYAVTLTPEELTANRTLTLPNKTGTIALVSDISGTYIGTTQVQTSSGNQALTGITSITMPGSTSGSIQLISTAEAGTNTITFPAATGTVALTSSKLSAFAATTSAELAGVISDETGSGALVFATSPTLVTPTLGVASATSINKVTITAPASSATLTIADGKTLTVSNTLTFTGTDASSVAFGTGGTVAYTSNKLSVFAATTSAELAGVISDETGSGLLVFATAPTFTTSVDGGATFAAFASSTALTIGYSGTAESTTNISTGAVANATTKTINIGTGGASGSTTNINLGSSNGGTVTVNKDLVVSGNLTVNGTVTTVNSTTITVDDKNIELGSVASPTDTTADGGGITLKGATDKTFNWVNATGAWTSSEHIELASGKAFYINGTSVLNATTLGSGVVNSSLTKIGLSSAGFVKTDSSGNLSVDTNTYTTTVSFGTTGLTPNTATSGAITVAGTLKPSNGGTGLSTVTNVGELYYGNDTTAMGRVAPVAAGSVLVSAGTANAPAWSASPTLTTSLTVPTIYGSSTASGTLTISSTSNATKGTITIGDATGTVTLNGAAVNLPTGAVKVGNTTLAQGVTGTITFPATAGTLALTGDIKDGQLTAASGSAGATSTTVALEFSATYSANTASNVTVKPVVGPALTALASTMTGAGTGFLRKNGADIYTLDTNTYLTSATQSNDFGTVTVTDTDSGHTWTETGDAVADTAGDTLTIVSGKGIDVDVSPTTDAIRIESAGAAYGYSDAITVTEAAPAANTAFNLTGWTKANFRAIKFVIGVVQGTTLYQTSEIMVFNDGTTAGQWSEFAVLSNDATKEVTYTIDFSGTTAYLKAATPTATTSITFNIHRTFIAI